MGKNLTLTGMMGVGKSTIGKNLAKKLKYNFIDVDKLIEIKEGISINMIFKNKSENYFRKIENDITLSVLRKSNSVISLGGGAFLNDSIRKISKKLTVSFWLDVPTDELIKVIIVKTFSDKQIQLSNKNLEFIIKNIDRSYEKISKFTKDIDNISLSTGKSININLIKKLLKNE